MDTILNTDIFQSLMQWLEGKQEAEPEKAGEFITTLNEIYIKKRLLQDNRPRTRSTGSRLSLSNIAAQDYLDTIEKGHSTIQSIEAAKQLKRESSVSSMGETGEMKAGSAGQAVLPSPSPDKSILSQSGEEQEDARDLAKALKRSPDGFIESETDSLLVASAIAYYWGTLDREVNKGRPATAHLVMLALYICYGCALAQRYTRIVAEKPQMWKYGIVFPRAYNKSNTWLVKGRDCALTLEKENPMLTDLIKDILPRIGEKGITKTADRHKAYGTPWSKCNKAHPEQWNTPLDDKEIQLWFKSNIQKGTVI